MHPNPRRKEKCTDAALSHTRRISVQHQLPRTPILLKYSMEAPPEHAKYKTETYGSNLFNDIYPQMHGQPEDRLDHDTVTYGYIDKSILLNFDCCSSGYTFIHSKLSSSSNGHALVALNRVAQQVLDSQAQFLVPRYAKHFLILAVYHIFKFIQEYILI